MIPSTTKKKKTALKPASEMSHDEKSKAFIADASKRVARAIKAIQAVAKLGRSARYAHTDSQIQKLAAYLTAEVAKVPAAFKPAEKKALAETLDLSA